MRLFKSHPLILPDTNRRSLNQNRFTRRQCDKRRVEPSECAVPEDVQRSIGVYNEGLRVPEVAVHEVEAAVGEAAEDAVVAFNRLDVRVSLEQPCALFGRADVEHGGRLLVKQVIADGADCAVYHRHVLVVAGLVALGVAHRVCPAPEIVVSRLPVGEIGNPLHAVGKAHIHFPKKLGAGKISVGTVLGQENYQHCRKVVLGGDRTDVLDIFKESGAVFGVLGGKPDETLAFVDFGRIDGVSRLASEEVVVVVAQIVRVDYVHELFEVRAIVGRAELLRRRIARKQVYHRLAVGRIAAERANHRGEDRELRRARLVHEIPADDVVKSGVILDDRLHSRVGSRDVVRPINAVHALVVYDGFQSELVEQRQRALDCRGVGGQRNERYSRGGDVGYGFGTHDVFGSRSMEIRNVKFIHFLISFHGGNGYGHFLPPLTLYHTRWKIATVILQYYRQRKPDTDFVFS